VSAPGRWDPTLYEGSARYYAQGRLPYPPETAAVLRAALGLDGKGRLLDVGCGPGSLTLLLAPFFEEAVGVDQSSGMIAEAERQAALRGVDNVRWVTSPAEALPGGLGVFRVATFAQSFRWMDRQAVASAVRSLLEPGGSWVHVSATTHEGVGDAGELPYPAPPRAAIAELVHEYLGPTRREGISGEDDVLAAAGFSHPRRVTVPGQVHERSEDDVVASVFSLSWAAPHLFGERTAEFESDLRELLRRASPDGRFSERARDVKLGIWAN
jgi:ubiquinone/menaquinone biosynthesis C-methylase UbiE